MRSKKESTPNDILLAPKVLEQVRIYFFSIAILDSADRYNELISREKLILQIEDEFSEFLEKYKLDPENELCSFLELDLDTSPVSSEKKAISKLAHKLLLINKGLKKKILAQSKDNLASFWIDELKQITLNFIKWVSTTIIVVGFIKAFIYAELLDTPLSLLFSVQDYLNYGITSSLVPFFFIISIIVLLTESIFLSEYSNFNYTKRIKDKYDFSDAKETKPIHLFICIFGVILCFIFRHYLPEYYSFYELCLGVILIFFLIFCTGFLMDKTRNLFLIFSAICIIFSLITNLWMIPKSMNPKFAQSDYTHIIDESVELPNDAFYVETTSKYFIFSSNDSIYLVPIDKVLYSKKPIDN